MRRNLNPIYKSKPDWRNEFRNSSAIKENGSHPEYMHFLHDFFNIISFNYTWHSVVFVVVFTY